MTYFFDTDIAREYGVNEAIMIQNFAYWIAKNEANDKHFHDGRYWVYNSVEAFSRLFPFWTAAQIRHILKNLVDKGVIIKGNYNASQYDRTCWYAFTDSICEKYQLHLLNLSNGIAKNSEPIPNNNTNRYSNNNIDNNTSSNKGTSENLCLFPDSKYYQWEIFSSYFKQPNYEEVDLYYYWQVIADWSLSGGNKKRDWIATARNWIRSDASTGRLRRKPAQQGGVALSPDAVHYLEMSGGLFNE